MSEQIKLWFFRDLNDEQRLKLFGLFGLPVGEIGNIQGRQMIALRHIAEKLIALVRDETVAANTQQAAPVSAERKIEFRLSVTGHDGCQVVLSHWPEGYSLERHGEIVWREPINSSEVEDG